MVESRWNLRVIVIPSSGVPRVVTKTRSANAGDGEGYPRCLYRETLIEWSQFRSWDGVTMALEVIREPPGRLDRSSRFLVRGSHRPEPRTHGFAATSGGASQRDRRAARMSRRAS